MNNRFQLLYISDEEEKSDTDIKNNNIHNVQINNIEKIDNAPNIQINNSELKKKI